MSERFDERIIFPLSPSLLAAIEDYRFDRRLPSRAAALRRLIEIGLKVEREADIRRFVEEAVEQRRP